MKANIRLRWSAGAVGGILAILLGLTLRFFPFWLEEPLGQPLIDLSFDLPFALRSSIPVDGLVLVYMDEEAHRALKQDAGQAWSRSLHAELIRKLQAEGASILVFDVLFSESGDAQANQALFEAMRSHGKVVIGSLYQPSDPLSQKLETFFESRDFRSAAAGSGLVNLEVASNYRVRKHFSGVLSDDRPVPSLAWKTAELAGAPITRNPAAAAGQRWINYYGPPNHLPHTSYHLALNGDTVPNFFRNKIVFIGVSTEAGFASEKKESFETPYTSLVHQTASGAEIHATCMLNLIRGDWIIRLPPVAELILLVLCGGAAGLGLARLKPIQAAIAALCSSVLTFVMAFLLFRSASIWFGWLIIAAAQIPAAWLWTLLAYSIRLHTEKQILQRSLELHLSPARVQQILRQPGLLRPGAVEQEIAIMFTDIANFSKISARMNAEDLFKLLNGYFQASLACIHQTDGTVVKLIGDAVFAIWNAPFPQPDAPERAVRTALTLRDQLVHFDKTQHALPLRTRVGLHFGRACVGNVGSATRFDYTAISDAVNLASRLEGLNKHLGTELLATRDIQKPVESQVVSRTVGHFCLKGIDRPVEVHEIISVLEKAAESEPWRSSFGEGLFHFQRRVFNEARTAFERTLAFRPDDGPSQFYLGIIEDFARNPPPTDWTGEVILTEK